MSQVMGEVTPLWQWIIKQPLEYARSTSSGALLLGAVVLEPVVVLVSLPCRSWSALKMEDMQSGLRFDGKPRGRRRTPPSHDWIFVPRPCRRASHTGSQAFAHATDEVPETRAINHACRIPKLKYIGDACVVRPLMSFPAALCLLILLQDLCFRRMASAAARGVTVRHSGYDRCVLSVAPRCGSPSCTCPSQPCGVWLAESVRVLAIESDSASTVVLTRFNCFISWAKRSASREPLEAFPLALSC